MELVDSLLLLFFPRNFKFDSKSSINQIVNIKCDCHRFDLKSYDHALCAFLSKGTQLDRQNTRTHAKMYFENKSYTTEKKTSLKPVVYEQFYLMRHNEYTTLNNSLLPRNMCAADDRMH